MLRHESSNQISMSCSCWSKSSRLRQESWYMGCSATRPWRIPRMNELMTGVARIDQPGGSRARVELSECCDGKSGPDIEKRRRRASSSTHPIRTSHRSTMQLSLFAIGFRPPGSAIRPPRRSVDVVEPCFRRDAGIGGRSHPSQTDRDPWCPLVNPGDEHHQLRHILVRQTAAIWRLENHCSDRRHEIFQNVFSCCCAPNVLKYSVGGEPLAALLRRYLQTSRTWWLPSSVKGCGSTCQSVGWSGP